MRHNVAETREDLGKLHEAIRESNKQTKPVVIRVRGNRLFLRATLPDRQTGKRRQHDLRAGAPATIPGLRAAKLKAARLAEQICLGTFSWDKWLDTPDAEPGDTCREWIDRLISDHWNRAQKTPNRERSFREDYLIPYSKLPPHRPLTAELLKEVLFRETSPSTPRQRNRYCLAYSRLAKFAELAIDLSPYRINYTPEERDLPSDREIEEAIDRIKNPAWQWIAGIMAAYGLRPHELFHLDLLEMAADAPIVKVLPNTKTHDRLVLPCPQEWVERWNLGEKRWPRFEVSAENRDNKNLGARITPGLKRYGIRWTAYGFRDCYVIRLEKAGWPGNLAELMGGHSRETRKKSYLRHVNKRDLLETFRKLND